MKKDEFTFWDYLHGLFWAVLIAILVVPMYAAISNPPSRSLTTWLLIAYIALDIILTILYLFFTIPTDKRIIRALNKMGYKCHMDEGQIVFQRKRYNWSIFTNATKKRYRRVAFSTARRTFSPRRAAPARAHTHGFGANGSATASG